jgi:hypothetical protein
MRLARFFLSKLSRVVVAGPLLAALSGVSIPAYADDVEIVHAHFRYSDAGSWSVDVTLKHTDSGWEHYADAWRVVAGDGTVLGTRTLYHPHENEQPFTRSLGGVAIPAGATTVFVEAHDKVHGWSAERVQVDLGKSQGLRYEVSR